MLMWLNDRSYAAESFAKTFLIGYSGVGNDINKAPKPFTNSGLDPNRIYFGGRRGGIHRRPVQRQPFPDVIGVAKVGTVYTGKFGKIAEHGGDNPQDRDVPIVVAGPGIASGKDDHLSDVDVETTQIAPTILGLLGLDPNSLKAVQLEHTQPLPLG
jgi:hypothetical protein